MPPRSRGVIDGRELALRGRPVDALQDLAEIVKGELCRDDLLEQDVLAVSLFECEREIMQILASILYMLEAQCEVENRVDELFSIRDGPCEPCFEPPPNARDGAPKLPHLFA